MTETTNKYFFFRATFDEANAPRGYIDLFIKAQREGQGEYFTNKDLLIGCQVKLGKIAKKHIWTSIFQGFVHCRI